MEPARRPKTAPAASPEPLEGLYACGEALGGLFSGNYPGGSASSVSTRPQVSVLRPPKVKVMPQVTGKA